MFIHFMHYSFPFYVFMCLFIVMLLSFFPSFEYLPMAPKKSSHVCNLISRSSAFPLLLLILLLSDSMMQRHLRRTSPCASHTPSVRYFCLSCKTMWYLRPLGPVDRSPYVEHPLLVPRSVYRSFTSTFTLSIPLYPCSLLVFKVHVSMLL